MSYVISVRPAEAGPDVPWRGVATSNRADTVRDELKSWGGPRLHHGDLVRATNVRTARDLFLGVYDGASGRIVRAPQAVTVSAWEGDDSSTASDAMMKLCFPVDRRRLVDASTACVLTARALMFLPGADSSSVDRGAVQTAVAWLRGQASIADVEAALERSMERGIMETMVADLDLSRADLSRHPVPFFIANLHHGAFSAVSTVLSRSAWSMAQSAVLASRLVMGDAGRDGGKCAGIVREAIPLTSLICAHLGLPDPVPLAPKRANPGVSLPLRSAAPPRRPTERDLMKYADVSDCYDVVDGVAARWPSLSVDSGYFVRRDGRPADHAWLHDADGTIYDPTYGQFDRSRPVLIARRGDAAHARYHSWDAHHAPDCLHRKLGVGYRCEAPGCDYVPSRPNPRPPGVGTPRPGDPAKYLLSGPFLDGAIGDVVVEAKNAAGKVIGFARAKDDFSDPGRIHVDSVYVASRHRGRGLAEMMIRRMIERRRGARPVTVLTGEVVWVGIYKLLRRMFGAPSYVGDVMREYSDDEALTALPTEPPRGRGWNTGTSLFVRFDLPKRAAKATRRAAP